MTTRTIWKWQQAEGEHADEQGTATYFPGMPYEVTVPISGFTPAHELANAIEAALYDARYKAHAGLLTKIGRIQP